jgi:spermidine/putrescine transport system permease protein
LSAAKIEARPGASAPTSAATPGDAVLELEGMGKRFGPIEAIQLLEVAKVCGARPWWAFLEITWPLNWMGTAIGIVLVVIPTLAATVTPRFLGGPDGALYGNILEHQFGATGTWALGSAMGVVLFLVSLLVIWLLFKSVNLKRAGFTGAVE